MKELAAQIASIIGDENLRAAEPMSAHTTFQIGGAAALFAMPPAASLVAPVVAACADAGVEHFVLGCGSDLLVADEGYDGVIISLTEGLGAARVEGERLVCEAGVTLRKAAEIACESGLSGLEFACGIPGSVGGACFMNAGAYGGCIADALESVLALTPAGAEERIAASDLALGYRRSRIADEGLVVLSATFGLKAGDPRQIRESMDDLDAQRAAKQPLELPSAGSTFKRPEGHFAGKLISDAGLKGYRCGGAAVSEKHAGFVVNLGGATAADVRAVIAHVQDEVERRFGVRLEPEVRFLP